MSDSQLIPSTNQTKNHNLTALRLLASFAFSYAMDDLGWKFYMVNASYDVFFLAVVYFLWVETAGVPLEEIAMRFGDLNTATAADIVEGIEQGGHESEVHATGKNEIGKY